MSSISLCVVFFACTRGEGWGGWKKVVFSFFGRLLSEAALGDAEVVDVLVKAKAKIDLKDNDGQTALFLAVKNWKTEPNQAVSCPFAYPRLTSSPPPKVSKE